MDKSICDFKLDELKCGLPMGHGGAHKNTAPQPMSEWSEWKWNLYALAFVYHRFPHFQTNKTASLSPEHLARLLMEWNAEQRTDHSTFGNMELATRAVVMMSAAITLSETEKELVKGIISGTVIYALRDASGYWCENCERFVGEDEISDSDMSKPAHAKCGTLVQYLAKSF